LTLAALAATLTGATTAAAILVGIVGLFATLEAVVGFCAGCTAFGYLMRAGVVPETVCEECNNITLRWQRQARQESA
jgi:hypothetical protein